LKDETTSKQEKINATALKKWEKKQAKLEAKVDAEKAAGGKTAPAKKAPPPKKGHEVVQPHLEGIEMLEVPQITDYTSESGNNYVRERSLDFIAESLMKPADAEHDDSEVSSEEEAEPEPEPIK